MLKFGKWDNLIGNNVVYLKMDMFILNKVMIFKVMLKVYNIWYMFLIVKNDFWYYEFNVNWFLW